MPFGFKLALLFLWLVYLECLCVQNDNQRQIPNDDALNFMKKYGYLVSDNGQSEAIYSEENLSNIIKNLQRFGAIEETGVIDNETVKLMGSPRCGVPDIIPTGNSSRRKRFATISGWNKRHLTYYISNWSARLGENAVARNIQKALDIWGGYGRLTFTRTQSPDADIIVAFGRQHHGDMQVIMFPNKKEADFVFFRYPFDGPGGVLAHGFFPSGSERADEGGDIHFDDEEEWIDGKSASKETGGSESTDFFTVALHELGHSLGLAHSDVSTSVMFPYYQGWDANSQNYLDYDDILGMYRLYIQRRLKEDEMTPQLYPEETTSTRRPWSREPEQTTPGGREREESTVSGRRRNP
ncbi:hypothetical protein HUJ05_008280 [Dendroctonus ponderosae]|nr:hypothetical protein HUJ05_008280 [Dendroctonus ponderosae]